MPGAASLAAGQYYAHPRNAFWPLMGRVLDADMSTEYSRRLEVLQQAGIALWDVIACCERKGSLDSAISPETVVVNDFSFLFAVCPEISHIFFNGTAAETAFRRHVRLPAGRVMRMVRLPSTSPAHAGMTLAQKCMAWAEIADVLGLPEPCLPD